MKKLVKAATIVLLMAISYSIGYIYQYNKGVKHYQAACILNDVCHQAMDNMVDSGDTLSAIAFEELYEDVVCNVDCYPEIVVTTDELRSYCWSY